MDKTERGLVDKYADMERAEKEKRYYANPSERCDKCGIPFEKENLLFDVQISDSPFMWGDICYRCFYLLGAKIGWGKGQIYLRDEKGWLMIGGFEGQECD